MLFGNVFSGITQIAKGVMGLFVNDETVEFVNLSVPQIATPIEKTQMTIDDQVTECEIWKAFEFDGRKVEISNRGRLRAEQLCKSNWQAEADGWFYPMSSYYNKEVKYWYCSLFDGNGKKKSINLTLAVLSLFVAPKPKYILRNSTQKVVFKDGNSKNINHSNLRWSTLDEISAAEIDRDKVRNKQKVEDTQETTKQINKTMLSVPGYLREEAQVQLGSDLYWVPMPSYEGLYEISNYGYVRSLDREIVNVSGKKQTFKGRLLKRIVTSDGLGYSLSKGGKSEVFVVSKLMVVVFMADKVNFKREYKVVHKDRHNGNCHIDNLEIQYI